MNKRAMLLRQVQMHDFCCHEALLFLDTHPTDQLALEYFNAHKKAGAEASAAFEAAFGPLSSSSISAEKFAWVESPWPWETAMEGV